MDDSPTPMIYSVNHFVVYVCNAHLDTKGVCVCMPKNWQRTSHAIILWLFEYATYSILMQYWLLFSNCFFLFVCFIIPQVTILNMTLVEDFEDLFPPLPHGSRDWNVSLLVHWVVNVTFCSRVKCFDKNMD